MSQTCFGNFWFTSDPKSVNKIKQKQTNDKKKTSAKHIYLFSLHIFLHESQNAIKGCDENQTNNRMLQLQSLIWAENLDKNKHTHVFLKEMHPQPANSKSLASQD